MGHKRQSTDPSAYHSTIGTSDISTANRQAPHHVHATSIDNSDNISANVHAFNAFKPVGSADTSAIVDVARHEEEH